MSALQPLRLLLLVVIVLSVLDFDATYVSGRRLSASVQRAQLRQGVARMNRTLTHSATEGFGEDEVNTKDKNGNTPLHLACKRNENTRVAELLKLGGQDSVNVRNNAGSTPLLYAVNAGNIEIVKLLLKNGAYKTARDMSKAGETALGVAIDDGNYDMVALLLEEGHCAGSLSMTNDAGVSAFTQMDPQMKEFILSKVGAAELFGTAVIAGDLDTVRMCVEKYGVDINSPLVTSMHSSQSAPAILMASFRGRVDVFEYLMYQGAVVDTRKLVVFRSLKDRNKIDAICERFGKETNALLRRLADDPAYLPALLEADQQSLGSTGRHTSEFTRLKTYIRSIVERERQETVLHLAVRSNNLALVQALVQKFGVSKEPRNYHDKTPLMLALKLGLSDIADFLIQEGAVTKSVVPGKVSGLKKMLGFKGKSVQDYQKMNEKKVKKLSPMEMQMLELERENARLRRENAILESVQRGEALEQRKSGEMSQDTVDSTFADAQLVAGENTVPILVEASHFVDESVPRTDDFNIVEATQLPYSPFLAVQGIVPSAPPASEKELEEMRNTEALTHATASLRGEMQIKANPINPVNHGLPQSNLAAVTRGEQDGLANLDASMSAFPNAPTHTPVVANRVRQESVSSERTRSTEAVPL